MVNKNYTRGYCTERRIFHDLEKKGYKVFRTAGSHTLFDILAIKNDELLLIQAKRVKGKYYSFKKDIEEIKVWKTKKKINVKKQFWIYLDRLKGRKAGFEVIDIK